MADNDVDETSVPRASQALNDGLEVGPHPVGSTVVLRSIEPVEGRGEAVGFAVSGVVLRDDDDAIVVASISGSGKAARTGARGGPRGRNIIHSQWKGAYELGIWDGESVARVHRRGQCWSIWRFHDGHQWNQTWYGNLEAPWKRTAMGYDTQDWTLDVVAEGSPGTSDWTVRLKDDDELEWFISQGVYSTEQAEGIRQVGQTLVDSLEHDSEVTREDWSRWVPPRELGPTPLPACWQTPA
ncbi:DUF402 domain-containing protein [Brachybacterium sp. YJGR34]|uniref:DUF402 domain-containing protein n=1 Tax=Brachybacterium sp. YJGR34 TaxID=2059911 RepID=UPI00130071DA|nr:DUF402 domain-containing protein [Brachybacterium sp. YJGR34]